MNKQPALLLEQHFDTALESPDGIKKLRELILTLAMQGKLVKQDPKDQPVSELLKEIQAEKERLIKDGKIKKQKELPPIKPEEVPYVVPEGWVWTRLGEIFFFEYGDNLPSEKRTNTGEYPVYGSNGIVGTHNKASVMNKCIVIGRKGSAGALNLCLSDKCWVTDVSYSCIPPNNIDLIFTLNLFQNMKLDELGKGIKPGLNRNEVYILPVPLPPLAEQKRIVAKIDELMALCDRLETQRKACNEKQLSVHSAAINRLLTASDKNEFDASWLFIIRHFDSLYSVKENVSELKKTILTLAMQGKLVKQDPKDQPASELLKEIQAEKERLIKEGGIKKQKELPPIKPEEVPYVVPVGWEWTRLGEIGIINPRNNAIEDSFMAGFVPMPLISEGMANIHGFEERPWSEIKKGYTHFTDGDVGMAKITPCFENAKSCVFNGLPNGVGAGTTELHIFRNTFKSIVPLFLLFYLKNPKFIAFAEAKMTGSAGQKRVPTPLFTELIFPLPPLAEQKRIVAKIDELMALCDRLENQIDQATAKQSALFDAVLAKV